MLATHIFRHNYISFLKATNNHIAHEHDHKAAILWSSSKERTGMIAETEQNFDISHFAKENNLEDLERPFSLMKLMMSLSKCL